MREKDIDKLKKIIHTVEEGEMEEYMYLNMDTVKRFVVMLKRIEILKTTILKLDQKNIAELKSYKNPPDVIVDVMKATLIILGDEEDKMRVSDYVT